MTIVATLHRKAVLGDLGKLKQHVLPGSENAKLFDVLLAHDGETVQNVGRVRLIDAVEVEKQRVQRGGAGTAVFIVPNEGRFDLAFGIDLPEVLCKCRHVMRGVTKVQHLFADEVGDGDAADCLLEIGGGDDWELFDDIPVEVLSLHFLAR